MQKFQIGLPMVGAMRSLGCKKKGFLSVLLSDGVVYDLFPFMKSWSLKEKFLVDEIEVKTEDSLPGYLGVVKN